ncbi:hypothetical protein OBBRIDRAFT_826083 [Obba rivulosa]|uniref:DUF6534 domain-containing protein n=1 Tax=Obba rivulosa TaxID=1052685 RepID=A0A8E2B0Z2_9APHY|nr:hypothetical protein OBBRIDRAFT_826083 [Obba rivulosa]
MTTRSCMQQYATFLTSHLTGHTVLDHVLSTAPAAGCFDTMLVASCVGTSAECGVLFPLVPVLIGVVVAAFLYGITTLQTYIYFRHSQEDESWYKFVICFLWALDTLHQVLITHAVYYVTVSELVSFVQGPGPLDPTMFIGNLLTWSTTAQMIVTGVSDLVVRSLFCLRLWKLSNRNWALVVPIVTLSLLALAGCIYTVQMTQNKDFNVKRVPGLSVNGVSESTPGLSAFFSSEWDFVTILIANVAADILIASSLCIVLWRMRSGIPRSDSLLRVLMMYSINTGLLTSICEIATLVTYFTCTKLTVYLALFFILPKLLLNAFLASLNARQHLREAIMPSHISFAAIFPISTIASGSSRIPRNSIQHNQRFCGTSTHQGAVGGVIDIRRNSHAELEMKIGI